MNNKLKNKIDKVKVIYVKSDVYPYQHTQNMNNKKDMTSSKHSLIIEENCFCDKRNYSSKITNNQRISSSHELLNVPIKTDNNVVRDKRSFIDPKTLSCQRAQESFVYGKNSCLALFHSRYNCIVRAWFIQSVIPHFKEVLRWMAYNRKAYHIVDNFALTKISGTEHHGGVCFLIKKRNGITVQQWNSQANSGDCVIALTSISNPHNLGAIMRSCAHFGIKGVLLKNVALLESGAAVRTAEGGAEHVQPINSNSIVNALQEFRKAGYTIVATSKNLGTPLFKTNLPRKMVLMLGQERNGLSNSEFSLADITVYINGTGNVESLNVSVAAGILLGEWWRQNKY